MSSIVFNSLVLFQNFSLRKYFWPTTLISWPTPVSWEALHHGLIPQTCYCSQCQVPTLAFTPAVSATQTTSPTSKHTPMRYTHPCLSWSYQARMFDEAGGDLAAIPQHPLPGALALLAVCHSSWGLPFSSAGCELTELWPCLLLLGSCVSGTCVCVTQ